MYRSWTYDFRCERNIFDLQSAWLALGPYEWKAFDNDQYGSYIVARESETSLKIRVIGEMPDYSLEIDFDVEPDRLEQTQSEIFATIIEKLLPAVGATDIRDTSRETTPETKRPRDPSH